MSGVHVLGDGCAAMMLASRAGEFAMALTAALLENEFSGILEQYGPQGPPGASLPSWYHPPFSSSIPKTSRNLIDLLRN